MGPKVESVLRFLKSGGKRAVITSFTHLLEAVAGSAGTHIVANGLANESKREEQVCHTR
jgi:carbamate kinase